MSEESMFGSNSAPAQQGETSTPAQGNADTILQSITNEQGQPKYANVDTALEALKAAQAHIPNVEGRLTAAEQRVLELQEELNRRSTVEEFAERLNTSRQDEAPTPQVAGLDAEGAAKLFDQLHTQREQQRVRETNINAVKEAMLQKYGEKAEEMFYGMGESVSLSREDLNSLSGTSPDAVLRLVFHRSADAQSVLSGSTNDEVRAEARRSAEIAQTLMEQGVDIDSLSDPKLYKKYFRS
jgi:hypothetical protein